VAAGVSVTDGVFVDAWVGGSIAVEVGASVAVAGAQAASTRVSAKRKLNLTLFFISLFAPLHFAYRLH
jgi:hypothetical protein